MRDLRSPLLVLAFVMTACAPAPSSPATAPPPPATAFKQADLAPLFGAMEGLGPEAHAQYQAELRQVLAHPRAAAALAAFYDGLPAEARLGRWKAVYVASQLETSDVVPFLERVALARTPAPAAPAAGDDHDVAGPTDDMIKRRAAIGVALRHLAGDAAGTAAIPRLLGSGDREVALAAAIELFSAGKLPPAWVELLRARGIPTRFSLVSAGEQQRLMQIPTTDLRSKRPSHKHGGSPPALFPTTR